MRKFLLIAAALFVAAVQPALAQVAKGSVRLGAGKSASVSAVKPAEGAAYLEIALPGGTQKLEGLGDGFLPLKSGGREATLVTADLDGDGTDEIVVRGQVTSSASAILVFKWDAAQNQFMPVDFVSANDDQKPFLFAENGSDISVVKGGFEVKVTRVDQSGRSAVVLEKYRWDGDAIKYFEDH